MHYLNYKKDHDHEQECVHLCLVPYFVHSNCLLRTVVV